MVVDNPAVRPEGFVGVHRPGHENRRSVSYPVVVELQGPQPGGRNRDHVRAAEALLGSVDPDARYPVLRLHPTGKRIGLFQEQIEAHHSFHPSQLRHDCGKAGLVDRTTADYGHDPGVLAGKMLRTDTGNGSGARGAQQVGGHQRQRRARVLVVQHEGKDGARQTLRCVFVVRPVPLVPADIEAATQVARHRGEATVGTGDRHVGEPGFLRKHDVHSVIVVIGAPHEVIAFAQKPEGFLADFDASGCVQDTGFDHVGFREIEKVDRWVHSVHLNFSIVRSKAKPPWFASA